MIQEKSSWKKWRLLTHNGRHIWAFKPKSTNINDHLQSIKNFTDEEIKGFKKDFYFDKSNNPNSADKVFRSQFLALNSNTFTGQVPQADNNKQKNADHAVLAGIHYFSRLQSEEGHWPGDYGGPMFLLPGLIIASTISRTPFPRPHQEMMKIYLYNHQNDDGGWGMHIEGNSTMFGTVMQYVCLRLLGESAKNPNLQKARLWIKQHGGATGIPSWGKFYLSILNLYDWDGFNSLFPEMWLLPKGLPVHPWRYWCHSRMVYLPMAYCYGKRVKMPANDLISALREEIYIEKFADIDWPKQRDRVCHTDIYTIQSPVLKIMNFMTNGYEKCKITVLRNKAMQFILAYLNAEDEQTDSIDIGPVNQAINSICIWHAHGKNSRQFQNHVKRWYDYLWIAEDGMKMCGYNGSQLWDTAFATRAILESDLGLAFKQTLEKSYRFIDYAQIKQQHPSHEAFFRFPMLGSWPFSTPENGWPVADCTAEGLSALFALQDSGLLDKPFPEHRIRQAVDRLLAWQNKDGGWPTYEPARAPKWLEKLNPSEVFADIMIDYSWTECTSACIQALVEFQERYPDYCNRQIHTAIQQGLRFILQQQRQDGSWYGGWAVCFTYATWFAIEALHKAKNKDYYDDAILAQSIENGCDFLLARQKPDGGWGETFKSCSEKIYSEAETSQVVNTAWALLALQAVDHPDKNAIVKGISLLIRRQSADGDWDQENISGVFNYNCMITYSNYRNIFPIWALSRYYRMESPKRETVYFPGRYK